MPSYLNPPPLIDKSSIHSSSRSSTPRNQLAVVERLLQAGSDYHQHRVTLASVPVASFRPEISAVSRRLAGALPPLHKRAVTLAAERQTRLHQEISRQSTSVQDSRKISHEEAQKKIQEFSLWQERKKLKVEEQRQKLLALEQAACTFFPQTKSDSTAPSVKVAAAAEAGVSDENTFEVRMKEDSERRKTRLDQLRESAEARELKECRFGNVQRMASVGGGKAKESQQQAGTPRRPFQSIQAMSLDEIISLAKYTLFGLPYWKLERTKCITKFWQIQC
jgi:hypothetical protein